MGVNIIVRGLRLTNDQCDSTYTGYEDKSIAQLLMATFVPDHPDNFRSVIDQLDIGDLAILNYYPDSDWSHDKEPDCWRPPLLVASAIGRLERALRKANPDAIKLFDAKMRMYKSYNGAAFELEWLLVALAGLARHCEILAGMGEEQITLEVSD